MVRNVNVLIAGAGPVGLTLANELARYGVSVRIVDKAAQRTDKSKALVLWSRTLELFDHAGYVDRSCRRLPGAWRANLQRQGSDGAGQSTDIDSPIPTR